MLARIRAGWEIGLLVGLAGPALSAAGQHEFVLKDPETDFCVMDYQPFDGVGDDGPFSAFNSVGPGLYGEAREMAEFDLKGVIVPDGEEVVGAVCEVQITSVHVSSMVLGVQDGDTPDQLSVYGYQGDGKEGLADFQAGSYLASADTSTPKVGQVVSFDVTAFVKGVIGGKQRYPGFAIRGDEIGLMAILENGEYPRLTITTDQANACYADCDGSGVLDLFDFLCFQNAFGGKGAYADCNGDGAWDLFDFLCYANAFNDGCG